MHIVIDIGNTSITTAACKGKRIFRSLKVETAANAQTLSKDLKAALRKLAGRRTPVTGVLICSVVPKALKVTERIIKRELRQKPLVVGRDIKVPIKNRYRDPRQVGGDRLVCAYAALHLYGAPAVIVDLGTAITIDVISRKKEYLGGIIVPGVHLSVDTLFAKAALLPKVKIDKPRTLIGKDTKGSILSGIFYGYGEMITGLITQVSKKVKGKARVIITGGHTQLMRKYITRDNIIIDKTIALKGLNLLFLESSTLKT